MTVYVSHGFLDGAMIFTSITIDYLNQLIRTGYPGAENILQELRDIGESLGATVSQRTSPLIMSFPDIKPFDLIQASEGISQASKALMARADQLRGVTLIVHQADTLEDALPIMQSARFTIDKAFGATLTREAKFALRTYFQFSDSQQLSVLHNTTYQSAVGDADASVLSERPELTESLKTAWDFIRGSDAKAVLIDAGRSCRSARSIEAQLREMTLGYKVLNLCAPRTGSEEFSPFTQVLTTEIIDSVVNTAGDTIAKRLSDLRPAFKLAASSRLSGKLPVSVIRGTEEDRKSVV